MSTAFKSFWSHRRRTCFTYNTISIGIGDGILQLVVMKCGNLLWRLLKRWRQTRLQTHLEETAAKEAGGLQVFDLESFSNGGVETEQQVRRLQLTLRHQRRQFGLARLTARRLTCLGKLDREDVVAAATNGGECRSRSLSIFQSL